MSIDEGPPRSAGIVPPKRFAESSLAGAAQANFMEELSSIDERIAAIQQMQGNGNVGMDDLLGECVAVWSRIKQLQQRLGAAAG